MLLESFLDGIGGFLIPIFLFGMFGLFLYILQWLHALMMKGSNSSASIVGRDGKPFIHSDGNTFDEMVEAHGKVLKAGGKRVARGMDVILKKSKGSFQFYYDKIQQYNPQNSPSKLPSLISAKRKLDESKTVSYLPANPTLVKEYNALYKQLGGDFNVSDGIKLLRKIGLAKSDNEAFLFMSHIPLSDLLWFQNTLEEIYCDYDREMMNHSQFEKLVLRLCEKFQ